MQRHKVEGEDTALRLLVHEDRQRKKCTLPREALYMKVYVFSVSVFVSIPSATSPQKVSHQLGRHQALLAFLCFVHIVVLTHPSFPTFIQTQAAQ